MRPHTGRLARTTKNRHHCAVAPQLLPGQMHPVHVQRAAAWCCQANPFLATCCFMALNFMAWLMAKTLHRMIGHSGGNNPRRDLCLCPPADHRVHLHEGEVAGGWGAARLRDGAHHAVQHLQGPAARQLPAQPELRPRRGTCRQHLCVGAHINKIKSEGRRRSMLPTTRPQRRSHVRPSSKDKDEDEDEEAEAGEDWRDARAHPAR